MSTIAQQVVDEHRLHRYPDMPLYGTCKCAPGWTLHVERHAAHVAEVTERATRERIVADIEAARERRNVRTNTQWIVNPEWMAWGQRLLKDAARIAGGDSR